MWNWFSYAVQGMGETRVEVPAPDYLGPFLGTPDRNRDLAWCLSVSVSAGTAFYGTRPPQVGGGRVAVAPAEQLVKIRERYSEGDGPIAALQNALQIARAYPPDSAQRAA